MLKIAEHANPNYLASIEKITEVFPIEGADRLVRTVIGGFDMVVSKDMEPGDYVVYFPVETQICDKFLSRNNLYEFSEAHLNANYEYVQDLMTKANATTNADEAKELIAKAKSMCGFFSKKRRVRMLKLRGQYSMGFVIPVGALFHAYPELKIELNVNDDLVGTQFNMVGDEEICCKYIPKQSTPNMHCNPRDGQWKKLMRKTIKRFDKLIEGQFAFHYDTKQLQQDIDILKPDDQITLTTKVHGTSVILANVLCNRKLTWWEKIKKFFGCKVQETEYGNIYSSRKVIKNRYINPKANDFYSTDVWGSCNKVFSQFLTPGMTVYGEIVGYCENSNSMIQKNYDYGCEVGQWKFMPYRITLTAKDGSKSELSVVDVMDWVEHILMEFGDQPAYGNYKISDILMRMDMRFIGRVCEMYPNLTYDENWHANLLELMKNDKKMLGMELDEPMCKNKVPREGVVLRLLNDLIARAWKLKAKIFYELEAKQHDNGEVDMEEEA